MHVSNFPREIFEEYFAIARDFRESHVLAKEYYENSPSGERVRKEFLFDEDLCRSYIAENVSCCSKLGTTKLVSELKKQPCMKKVLAFNFERDESEAEYMYENLMRYREKYLESTSLYKSPHRFYTFCPTNTYFFEFAGLLYEYLFVDATQIREKKIRLLEKISILEVVYKDVNELSTELNALVGFPPFRLFGMPGRVERLREDCEVEKKSAHLAEKIFAEKMIRLNKRWSRRPLLSKVQDAMHLPFFEHQFDMRTLSRIQERMLSRYSEKMQRRKAGEAQQISP